MKGNQVFDALHALVLLLQLSNFLIFILEIEFHFQGILLRLLIVVTQVAI